MSKKDKDKNKSVDKDKTEINFVKTASSKYSDHLDESGLVTVTAWVNGEGYDVNLEADGLGSCGYFPITHTQWETLKKVMKEIQKE